MYENFNAPAQSLLTQSLTGFRKFDATVYAFLANQPNGSQLVHKDLEQIHGDDLEEKDLKWQLGLLSIRARSYFQRTGKKITIIGSDTAGYNKTKVECFNCHKMGYFLRECKSPRNQENMPRNQDSSRKTANVKDTYSKAMVETDGAGFDWSYMADDEVPTNMALTAFSDSEELQFNLFSVLRMCDKKNSVLFTDIECFVLSPDFKLADESQVLLKVPRKNNMYSFDMKNILPQTDLNCLLAKATNDESMLLHRRLDQLGKFDGKSDERIFVGYSTISKAFRVYNIRTRKVEENLHITFLKNKPIITGGGPEWLFDNDSLSKLMNYTPVPAGTTSNDFADGHNKDKHGPSQVSKSDNQERPNAESSTKPVNTAGPVNTATPTYDDYPNDPLMSNLEDVGIFDDAYDDRNKGAEADYNNLETEELFQFNLLNVWTLVDLPHEKRAIGTKWVYRNKRDHRGITVRNKVRLVAQGHKQEEGIDYDEFIFICTIEEEVYVSQPPGFVEPEFPDRVYKVEKALYGLHQALRAWYETLPTYLLDNGCISREGRMEHIVELIDIVSPTPYDSPLTGGYKPRSDEGRLKLKELIDLYTTLSNRVSTLENELSSTKVVYHKAFITLTKRVKKLETQLKQKRSRAVIHSSDEEEPSVYIEDSPKQGRMIEELDKDKDVNLVSQQGEVQEIAEPLKYDDDATLAETLLNIKRKKGDQAKEIDWNDPTMLRYHALYNRPFSKAEDLEIKNEVMKRSRFHLQQESLKRQKLDQQTKEKDEEVKAQADSDQEVEEMKLYKRIVPDEDIAINAIPLATKPPMIVEYKIVKEGKISTYHITRADGSTKRYTLIINLLKNINREDLEPLWKLVKDKHGNTRP
nr:retrovirus-related Pol polyprotein from transposon TNT 1-94 [Tanacetum cinerariifolium]